MSVHFHLPHSVRIYISNIIPYLYFSSATEMAGILAIRKLINFADNWRNYIRGRFLPHRVNIKIRINRNEKYARL